MATTTETESLQKKLEKCDLNQLADALRLVGGKRHAVIKIVVTSMTAIAAPDITGALVKAAAVITGIDALVAGELLPAVGEVISLRVTASGTATSVGSYIVSDAAETPLLPPGGASTAVGIAALADDGSTITFPNTITAFILTYKPRSVVAMTRKFALDT